MALFIDLVDSTHRSDLNPEMPWRGHSGEDKASAHGANPLPTQQLVRPETLALSEYTERLSSSGWALNYTHITPHIEFWCYHWALKVKAIVEIVLSG